MSTVLSEKQRKHLDTTVQKAREISEAAARDALTALAVAETHRPAHLDDAQNELRLALRAKARQLGDDVTGRGADLTLLERDVAYEQWHRLLFARFLERNDLLRHGDFPDTAVFLEDCEDLASSGDIDEPDGWSVAARFAAQLLPGVFRFDDPAFRVRYATEHRLALEQLLMSIPAEVFEAEDALGWVYQFWQTAAKKRVNERGDKIGGADLSPVTQLFTENYMVRFLLENSLGAWWAARHPESPLVAEWEYLRRLDDGTPAAGTFEQWPTTAADVTVMDPCCGSGHFLVAMFGMLWRMRAEEEGLTPSEAQDAVLRDNLFGLELDPRCTQIATFNVALEAWKQGGHRELPTPQIACSGVPVRQSREEWLDGVPKHLHDAMARLHTQFRNADMLGSLIDPRPIDEARHNDALFGRDLSVAVSWELLQPRLAAKFAREEIAGSVLGRATQDIVRAASLLTRQYSLVATNPPYLQKARQSEGLRSFLATHYPDEREDLATAFVERSLRLARDTRTVATVTPQNWLFLSRYRAMRRKHANNSITSLIGQLGPGAFSGISGEVVNVCLALASKSAQMHVVDATRVGPESKPHALQTGVLVALDRATIASHPNAVMSAISSTGFPYLSEFASGLGGTTTGDSARFRMQFWEIDASSDTWELQQAPPKKTSLYAGRDRAIRWESGTGALHLAKDSGATIAGRAAWGNKGVAVGITGNLPATLYLGDLYENVVSVIVPKSKDDLPVIWAFCSSDEFRRLVREIDQKLGVTSNSLVKIPFDRQRWQKVADEMGPLPEPHSDDPTQWLFQGDIATSTQPLQVAVARLLGFRWPDQVPDTLDRFTDADGIVTLSNLGEGDAASRLRELLAEAYGDRWSGALEHTLVTDAGGKTGRLEDWLRDTFFAHHCKVFDNRPFLWHVWDGRKDGFSAILNYHRLDRATLEKLSYTTLGSWIRRQEQELSSNTPGAEARLAAAQALQHKLTLIIEGEPPYDIYVRWKALHEQPLGWEPDLDDGVRLNIRPFVEAGILRSKVTVHWRKDRGKNPDGSERHNDLHFTLDEKRAARRAHGLDDA